MCTAYPSRVGESWASPCPWGGAAPAPAAPPGPPAQHNIILRWFCSCSCCSSRATCSSHNYLFIYKLLFFLQETTKWLQRRLQNLNTEQFLQSGIGSHSPRLRCSNKNNLNLRIKPEPVMAGAHSAAFVLYKCTLYCKYTHKFGPKAGHLWLQPLQIQIIFVTVSWTLEA